jgi:serpin B
MLSRLDASVTEVELHLPRFEVNFEAQMKDTLKIPTAFSTRANFSAMGHKNGQPLKIEAVIHKTYLKVDESGTEAAAVTAVLMNSYCASEETRRPPVMRVDHPFVFIITDMASGNILFAGGIKEVDVAPAQTRPQIVDSSYGWL